MELLHCICKTCISENKAMLKCGGILPQTFDEILHKITILACIFWPSALYGTSKRMLDEYSQEKVFEMGVCKSFSTETKNFYKL